MDEDGCACHLQLFCHSPQHATFLRNLEHLHVIIEHLHVITHFSLALSNRIAQVKLLAFLGHSSPNKLEVFTFSEPTTKNLAKLFGR